MYAKLMLRFILFLCFQPHFKPAFGIDTKAENYMHSRDEKHVLAWIGQVPKDVIPSNEDGPVVVRHLLSINRIGNLDIDQQILELFGWQSITWTDVRLAWDDFIQVDEIIVPVDLVWKPDIMLFNSATYPADFTKNTNARAHITKNGTVLMRVPMEHKSICRMPSIINEGDNVTCTLRLGSWNYDLRHMELRPEMDTAFLAFFQDVNRDWLLGGTSCSQVCHAGHGLPEISTIDYQIELEKRKHD